MPDPKEAEPQASPEKIIDLTQLSSSDLCKLLGATLRETFLQKGSAMTVGIGSLQSLQARGASGTDMLPTIEAMKEITDQNTKIVLGLTNALVHPEQVTIKTDYNYPGREPQADDNQYESPLLQPMDVIDLEKMAP